VGPMTRNGECKKFSPNIFHKSKCTNCFRQKEEHSAEALESNRVSDGRVVMDVSWWEGETGKTTNGQRVYRERRFLSFARPRFPRIPYVCKRVACANVDVGRARFVISPIERCYEVSSASFRPYVCIVHTQWYLPPTHPHPVTELSRVKPFLSDYFPFTSTFISIPFLSA